MKLDLTYDKAVELLERAVEEKGADYVYPMSDGEGACVYFDYDEPEIPPSCIVGHVFDYIDPSLRNLKQVRESFGVGVMIGAADGSYVNALEVSDPKVRNLLSEVQSQQDGGTPWGEAVEIAKEYVKEVSVA